MIFIEISEKFRLRNFVEEISSKKNNENFKEKDLEISNLKKELETIKLEAQKAKENSQKVKLNFPGNFS